MKKLLYIVAIALCAVVTSCNKDKDGWVTFDNEVIYVMDYGESSYTTFSCGNMTSLALLYYPDGWTISVSFNKRTVTATAPASASDGVDQGEVTLYGYDEDGNTIYKYLSVAKTEFIEIDDPSDDRQSNCLILSEPNRIYTFNPNRRGEETTEQTKKAASCELTWYTNYRSIRAPKLYDDGRIGIYTICDEDDVDEDDDTDDLIEGNALVTAFDSSGNYLWSWHIWITDSDPTLSPVTVNGIDFLPRNIGAFTNCIDSEDEIATSYGLYYQWGRKEPFVYPYYFDASNNYDTPLYDTDGDYVLVETKDVSKSKGKISYAQENPLYFILGTDWLYTSDDTLWGSGTTKSIYDPSPKGWRVPSAAELATLSWSAGIDTDTTYGYGTDLSGELFMALGRKTYLDGTTQNVSGDGTFAAWAGFYWSRDGVAGDTSATSLYFYIDRNGTIESSDDTVVVENSCSMERGNGMQIRAARDN